MDVLTYSLQDGDGRSAAYYEAADRFADEVLRHGERGLLPIARKWRRYVELTAAESKRTTEEYALDLLTLGVLWRTYIDSANRLPPWRGSLLRRAARVRQSSRRLKPAADRVRAAWGSRWLAPVGAPAGGGTAAAEQPTLAAMERLLLWLEASGEFVQEAARLRLCRRYLSRQSAPAAQALLQAALAEAAWFEQAAAAALSRYTPAADRFRAEARSKSMRREDALLRDRRPVEYHLNLLAAEVMNRAYQPGFTTSPSRAVLLPACLKARAGSGCAANRQGQPGRCLRCTKSCRVAQTAEMGQQDGFEVIIVSHESDAFSHSLLERLRRDHTGIVGVACALQLASGGLRAKEAGLSAQCVILDYCGCGEHWDDNGGFPTDLNIDRLRELVNQGRGNPEATGHPS